MAGFVALDPHALKRGDDRAVGAIGDGRTGVLHIVLGDDDLHPQVRLGGFDIGSAECSEEHDIVRRFGKIHLHPCTFALAERRQVAGIVGNGGGVVVGDGVVIRDGVFTHPFDADIVAVAGTVRVALAAHFALLGIVVVAHMVGGLEIAGHEGESAKHGESKKHHLLHGRTLL